MSNAKIGILGGGQLGRMSAQAAKKLGIDTVIFTPDSHTPASQVAFETVVANYDDKQALQEFAKKVDVISYEWENIPLETVSFLKNFKPVFPDANLLEVAQDRIKEKTFLNDIGIKTARWAAVQYAQDVHKILKDWNADSLILKTARFGYDGKGQVRITDGDDINKAIDGLNSHSLIAEEIVDFICEISVIVSRDKDGNMEFYGPMKNEHKNHILDRTTMPAGIEDNLSSRAIDYTRMLAETINLRGVLALEMFVTKDGRILANEIAPRTHNSGHWTLDACEVSQFENHVRAVCGLPVKQQNRHSDAMMINLIADDILRASEYESRENTYVHAYGKQEIKPGRKMGHVTILKTMK